jgi:Domain of unknown function (DUF3825)
MITPLWPESLFDLIFIPHIDEKLEELARLAEPEEWNYQHTQSEHAQPILYNYLHYTYRRLAEEGKIAISVDGQFISLNTGLVTANQEPIYLIGNHNHLPDARQPWHFQGWFRRGQYEMTRFSELPDMAHYFDDPSDLVEVFPVDSHSSEFDSRMEMRCNIEHIITENKERFPQPYCDMDDYALQTFLKGAIDNARERVRRNYKTS